MNRPGRLHHHAYVSRNLEVTRQFYVDNPDALAAAPALRARAHAELKRWLAGDFTTNNDFRPAREAQA